MKILQVNSVCGVGSTGRIAVDLYHTLVKQGHECCIAYGRGTAPNKVNTYQIGTNLDMIYHGGISRITDRQGFYSTHATKQLIKWMQVYNPDVIHLHNIHGYYLNIAILLHELKKMKKPIIWTLHDCWAFTGHCACFDYARCNKWKTGCCNCPQKKEYPASFLLDRSEKNYLEKEKYIKELDFLTVVTPSQWLAKLVRQSFMRDCKIEVIPNGVDITLFREEKSNFRKKHDVENKFILLGVASFWGERKGLDIFLELANRLNDACRIVLVGVSKQQKKKLPRNIIGIERTNNVKELAQIYTMADVFINPTKEDNYPTVNLEAQLCGTPVITFDSGGSGESICPEGIILKEKSAAAILESLEKVKKIVDLDRYSFSKELMMKRYMECYKKHIREDS